MIDTALAYLISLGIVAAGIGWIAETMRGSILFADFGAAAIAVGVVSLVSELEQKAH
jgi:hypothetical protein